MLSKTSLGLVASAGVCFIGYCIYFDRKRRSDPNFKEKLKQKRRAAKAAKPGNRGTTQIPDMRDAEAMQRFFLQEVQLGEELLAAGDIDGGVEHLSNAVAVCGQPQQLLQVLQQTLPPQVFQLLVQRVPVTSKRFVMTSATSPGMLEDDLE